MKLRLFFLAGFLFLAMGLRAEGMADSVRQKPVLLLLLSDQCPFCARLDQTLKTDAGLSAGIHQKYDLVKMKIDSDEGRAIASRYQLKKVPAFIVLDPSAAQQQIFTGFSSAAKLASLLQFDYNSSISERSPAATCGNGIIETGEACDDNNTTAGDGCSATCNIEPGFHCVGQPSVCASTCGDGMVAATEGCDDGNTNPGDGCSATCSVEPGFQCTGQPSVCAISCGNGILDAGEACDDMNTTAGDGCSPTCTVEPGFECTGQPSACQLLPVCGNGIIEAGEACDDGNTNGGDGCSSSCSIDPGWVCVGQPSVCITSCGDGVLDAGEECDDGNQNNGDGCNSACRFESVPQGIAVNNDHTRPHPSSMLDVKSNDKGILIPRMTSAQRTAIANPAKGLLVFDTTTGTFWFYNGTTWKQLATL